jgi:hypothetical protein
MTNEAETEKKYCVWVGTAARGVYRPDCRPEGVMGVPPKPGTPCPHCSRQVALPEPSPRPRKRGVTDMGRA